MKIIKAELRQKTGAFLSGSGREAVDHLLKLFANTDDNVTIHLIDEKENNIEIERFQKKLTMYYRLKSAL